MIVSFKLNGEETTARVTGPLSLLDMLRDEVGLPGSKSACEQGECGSCSIVLDGELVCSCLVLAGDVEGSEVTTVEGVAGADVLHPVQEAMHEAGAVQCGFCTPGFVVAAVDLFESNPSPTTSEIKEALAGNICRCTGYGAIIRAFEQLAGRGT
ncbi:MAG: (2Fe-2S)-binding protein [Actinobacteria bacterium]|nr:MAG: (2Fe-2S)-binding protein [Actinomycetota bacterium]REK35979.1 MAG: (2Fe-2S)-binding protein [Actinomycetota bacterium]